MAEPGSLLDFTTKIIAMKTTPTTKEIVQIMKDACQALEQFNKKHRTPNFCDAIEHDLELWSSNLRCHATTLNSRIIYK